MKRLVFAAITLLLPLSACNLPETVESAKAVESPTPVPLGPFVTEPTLELVAVAIPQFIFTQNAICRSGPGPAFEDMGSFSQGEETQIYGRTSGPDGFYYIGMRKSNLRCWVSVVSGEATGPLDEVPVLTPGPPPTEVEVVIPMFRFTQNAFCRSGPGTAYNDVDNFYAGDETQIYGRSSGQDGWYYVGMRKSNLRCWVSFVTGEATGPLDGVPVEAASPPPPPPEPQQQAANCGSIQSDSLCNYTAGCTYDYNAKVCVAK